MKKSVMSGSSSSSESDSGSSSEKSVMSGSSSSSESDSGSSSESESDAPSPQTPTTSSAPQKQALRYPAPTGFSELDVLKQAGIMKEDLSSEDELWIVKMPLGFSPMRLNGTKCEYQGNTQLSAENEKTDFPFVWDVSLKPSTAQGDAFSVLLPSETTGRLQHAGHFKGEMTVRKQLKPPPKLPMPVAKPKGYALPEGLKQRFVPFGSVVNEAAVEVKKESRKRTATSDTESTPKKVKLESPEVNGVASSEKKKKKKKDKHKERDVDSASGFESASGLETDTTLDTSISKKKKKKKDKVRIKEEQDSVLDVSTSDASFLDTSVNSAKKKKKKSKEKDMEHFNSTMTTSGGENSEDFSLNGGEKKKKKKKKKSKDLE